MLYRKPCTYNRNVSFHKKCADIPELLTVFIQQYAVCNKECINIPRKQRELIPMVLGCSKGVEITIRTHAEPAMEHWEESFR